MIILFAQEHHADGMSCRHTVRRIRVLHAQLYVVGVLAALCSHISGATWCAAAFGFRSR